ncbi:MAG: hypothetical protein QM750_19260 [Rubrivivax sp.]
MTRFVEVRHSEWIAAPRPVVCAQFADLEHHIRVQVHPKLRFEPLLPGADGCRRFVQEVRLLGLRQRDLFERRIAADGTITDRAVEGFNRGGSLHFEFAAESREGRDGTCVRITVRLPLPPLIGPLLRPLLAAQLRRELRAAALEDKRDLEQRGYPSGAAPRRMHLAA